MMKYILIVLLFIAQIAFAEDGGGVGNYQPPPAPPAPRFSAADTTKIIELDSEIRGLFFDIHALLNNITVIHDRIGEMIRTNISVNCSALAGMNRDIANVRSKLSSKNLSSKDLKSLKKRYNSSLSSYNKDLNNTGCKGKI